MLAVIRLVGIWNAKVDSSLPDWLGTFIKEDTADYGAKLAYMVFKTRGELILSN